MNGKYHINAEYLYDFTEKRLIFNSTYCRQYYRIDVNCVTDLEIKSLLKICEFSRESLTNPGDSLISDYM